jgi:hypothetical protein
VNNFKSSPSPTSGYDCKENMEWNVKSRWMFFYI